MDKDLKAIDIPQEEDLQHYGVSVLEGAPGVGSGRYPLGSGNAAYQHERNFRTTVSALRNSGMKDVDIAKHLQIGNVSDLRARISKSKERVHAYEVAFAKKLKAKGMSNTAIAKRMFNDEGKESTVRNLLKEGNARKDRIFEETTQALKDELERHPFLDVGKGTELYLNISETRLKNVLNELEKDGYSVHNKIQVEQYGSDTPGQKTTVRVLTKEGVSDREVYQHLGEIVPPGLYLDDRTDHIRKIEPPASIDPSRVYIRYAEDDGKAKDGVIELRRGVEDLSLGGANYAQVRIAVNNSHYLKGMALYSDNVPPGYDVVFNTNKHKDKPMLGETNDTGVLKKLKTTKDGSIDITNPFGAAIKTEDDLDLSNESKNRVGLIQRQRHYLGADGEEHLSAINIVNEEGSWNEWSRDISAQMLSKQPPAVAKRQLDLTTQLKKEQLNDILSLTNPTVKKHLLEEFANQCDSDAVHLKALGFPNQVAKVILPVDGLKDNECYCPQFDTGTPVVLIRYPHAGRFEIPSLVVNNNHKEAKSILGQAIDAIGINSRVAAHLSGADFDGDTVWVIPNPNGDIKTMNPLPELKDFDPKEAYPGYPGMKKISVGYKNKQMGVVSNLITDMTIAGASWPELARAVKHSMVIIDAEKHGLDWKRSEKENGIRELREKYQVKADGSVGGASTLISQAKSEYRMDERVFQRYDSETGEKIYRLTGKLDKKGNPRQTISTKMAETDDARTLISKGNSLIENVYAQYANNMKELARQARYEMVHTPNLKYDPEAHDQYAAEVASLTRKLRDAQRNKPLERQALILANVKVKQDVYDDPSIKEDKGAYKKLKGRTLQRMRERVGALKQRVFFTDSEWKAIQAGAVSNSFLKQLLENSSDDHVKALSMPREKNEISATKTNMIQQLLNNHYTYAEIAKMQDVSVGTVQNIAKEMR